MPNNVCVSVIPFLPYTNNEIAINNKLAKADKRISKFADRIESGRVFLRGFNLLSRISGNIQRVPFRHTFPRLRDDIRIDSSRCMGCMQCVRRCPSGNIRTVEAEGKDEFKTEGTCILCLRCYNFCPVSAIMYMNKPHNKKRGQPYKGPGDGFTPEMLL